MDLLAPFHSQIIHAPIVLLIMGLLFEIVGRLTDLEWWRKAAFAMLVLGVLGAGVAVLSGGPAGDAAEEHGVPEAAVDAHERAADLTLYLGLAALVARIAASALRRGRAVLSGLALLLWIAAAVAVGVTGHRGGKLVFEHGAAVRVKGQYVSGKGTEPAPAHAPAPGQPDRD